MDLVIEVKRWIHNTGHEGAVLCREDQFDILGWYLSSLGVPAETMRDKKRLSQMECVLPEACHWLLLSPPRQRSGYSDDGQLIICLNDMIANGQSYMKEEERRQRLQGIFARHDVLVSFIGE